MNVENVFTSTPNIALFDGLQSGHWYGRCTCRGECELKPCPQSKVSLLLRSDKLIPDCEGLMIGQYSLIVSLTFKHPHVDAEQLLAWYSRERLLSEINGHHQSLISARACLGMLVQRAGHTDFFPKIGWMSCSSTL